MSLDFTSASAFGVFSLGPVYCSRNLQVRKNAYFALKLGLTTLFTHLKIILLQYFQFLIISGIQTNTYYTWSICTNLCKYFLFILANFSLKLCPTALFTHLKIILLQYFQFSTKSGIQTDS